MSFHCSACNTDVHYVDHELLRTKDGDLRIPHHSPSEGRSFWPSHNLTRDQAIARRRLIHVSPWLCLDRDCGRIVEHERPVLPSVLPRIAAFLLIPAIGLGIVLTLLGPTLFGDLLRSRHAMQAGAAAAVIFWLVGMGLAATFTEALARLRYRNDFTPARPPRCTHCGSRRLEPLILPRRITQARRKSRPSAHGLTCPNCRGRTMWYKNRWVV